MHLYQRASPEPLRMNVDEGDLLSEEPFCSATAGNRVDAHAAVAPVRAAVLSCLHALLLQQVQKKNKQTGASC